VGGPDCLAAGWDGVVMTMPEEIGAGLRKGVRPAMRKAKLVAESGADGDTLAARGAAAAENGGAALGLHARPEAVSLYAAVAVGLKRALGHGIAPASTSEIVAVTASFKYIAGVQLNPASTPLQRGFDGRGLRGNPFRALRFQANQSLRTSSY